MNDVAPKTATSGGPLRSGAPASPPAPPSSPPPPGDDDSVLTVDEVYELLRLEGNERTPEAIAGVPRANVGGVERFLRGVVMSWLARGGDRPTPRGRGPFHHRGG